MKLVKQASGKTTIKMSKSEWTEMGKKAGWLSKVAYDPYAEQITEPDQIPNGQNEEQGGRSISQSDPSYQRVVKHYQELKHALKTQNAPAAGQARENLKQMKSFLESNGVQWQSDPILLEALSDI
jgi:hypothetical protein